MQPGALPQRRELVAAMRGYFGHEQFRPGQLPVIQNVLAGRDTLAIMPTGAGKSLCYQLPAMLLKGTTVVFSPLIALMKDQLDSLPEQIYAQASLINSSVEREEVRRRLARVRGGSVKLLYVAPERLRQLEFVQALKGANLSLAVIDEAHCVSVWGHDFRPDYLFIRRALGELSDPAVLAMTATATPRIADDIDAQLGRQLHRLSTGVLRPNLRYQVIRVRGRSHKEAMLLRVIEETSGCGIVYAGFKQSCEELAGFLVDHGVSAAAYHAGLDPAQRTVVQEQFMLGNIRVVVATIAFGMGIDKANIRFIIHTLPSRSLEGYSQESGRAGRDGKPSRCVLLLGDGDIAYLADWVRKTATSVESLRRLYAAIQDELRRRPGFVSLSALETVCAPFQLDPKVGISILERAGFLERGWDRRALGSEVRLTDAPDGRARLETLLAGMLDNQLQQVRDMEAYAEGGACRQRAIAAHFGLDLSADCGSCDRCSARRTKAKRASHWPASAAIWPAPAPRPAKRAELDADEAERFERLRSWRQVRARRDHVPEYQVFPDVVLRRIAQANPQNWRVLRSVAGGDSYKIDKYGDEVLQLLAHTWEN
jgi:RecQ family ATP-dependent DNA helicase